jgi:hypothetical protein
VAPLASVGPVPPITGLGDYVTATPAQIQRAVRAFLHPPAAARRPAKRRAAPKRRSNKRRARVNAASYHLVTALRHAKAIVRPRRRSSLPLYAPAWLTSRGRYARSTPRLYSIPDRGGHRHRAYRFVVAENESEGQYYGIEGTTWRTPPVLVGAHDTVRMAGRTYQVYYDGAHVRRVAWRTSRAAYWVSNSLGRALSNREMLGIARSLTRLRAR